MATTTTADDRPETDDAVRERPEIDVCETCPGTRAFIESGNTDGWITTDCVVTVRR